MNEEAQIFAVLSSTPFWKDDQIRVWSMTMAGGMSVGIEQQGSCWTWRITRPDGSQCLSPQSFPSVRDAKNELQAELKRRREALVYESTGPAIVS
jgi:hypothetical protein